MLGNVIWSPVARITYYQILEYLEQNWTTKEIENFINRVEYVVQHIRKNPFQYPASKEKSVHRCVVAKQISLFFRLKGSDIELLVF
jgi:plasmid stabilization system protein ParE